jgi:NADH-quinone oxidoreductase subunit L
MYGKRSIPVDFISGKAPWLHTLLYRKYFIDELYDVVFVRSLKKIGQWFNRFDDYVVDGAVRALARGGFAIGQLGTRLQNGQVQSYGLIMLLGLLILALVLAGGRFI